MSKPNRLFDEWFIQVGSKYYKMQLDGNDAKKTGDTCIANDYVYKVTFVEEEYKTQVFGKVKVTDYTDPDSPEDIAIEKFKKTDKEQTVVLRDIYNYDMKT